MDSDNISCRINFDCFHDFTLDKLNDVVLRRAPAGAKLWKISQAGFLSKIGEKIHNVEISWNWYLWNNAQCLWKNSQWKFVKNFTLSVKNFTMKVCEIINNVCEEFHNETLWRIAQSLWNNAQWKFVKSCTKSVKNFSRFVKKLI